MQSKTNLIRAEVARCEAWYANRGENIRLLTERTEELWFEMDDLVVALQEAESSGDTADTNGCINALLHYALDLQTEAQKAHRK